MIPVAILFLKKLYGSVIRDYRPMDRSCIPSTPQPHRSLTIYGKTKTRIILAPEGNSDVDIYVVLFKKALPGFTPRVASVGVTTSGCGQAGPHITQY